MAVSPGVGPDTPGGREVQIQGNGVPELQGVKAEVSSDNVLRPVEVRATTIPGRPAPPGVQQRLLYTHRQPPCFRHKCSSGIFAALEIEGKLLQ